MADNVYGRDFYMEKIKRYAESSIVGNQAFLGVKGVGKTALFQAYFTKKKRGEIAQNYQKLFVFSQLDSRKRGSDLYKFLIDQVKIGIMGIPDKNIKQDIRAEMNNIDEIFETLDGRLTQYLTVIKESGYDLIIIMDQFHCMARDTEIGKEQYDVLRSFNEQKLITYWIITDTDLMETCASKQYIASFFAQKFTSKLTICPLSEESRSQTVDYFESQKKTGLTETEKLIISKVSGGIPELMSILIDAFGNLKNEGKTVTVNSLLSVAITNNGCISLLNGWTSGLNSSQKKILYDVAISENGLNKDTIPTTESKMAELSDEVGRGLLHVSKENNEKVWRINTSLFQKYIISKGDSFYQDIYEPSSSVQKPSTEAHVTNIFNIEGNFIQSQTNNILNIENAVEGLEDLQRLVHGNPALLDESQAKDKLDYLPFKQQVWYEMSGDEQEEELEKYADGIFSSEIFSRGLLTSQQMQKFNLSEELLGNLSNSCRTQIICGVQVYNLIQLCIDNFGLSMSESESPRGILFVRAFERHLKDFVAPTYCRIPELASQQVFPTTKPFREYPIDKTTIGTYSIILGHGYRIFAQASTQLLGYIDRDEVWWRNLVDRLSKIGDLRNECCHSGTTFGNEKLSELIERVFTHKSLEDILIFNEIPALRRNQFPIRKTNNSIKQNTKCFRKNNSNIVKNQTLDESLIGKTVQFKILSKTARGNFKGAVNSIYEGSLPKSCTIDLEYLSVKGTIISAIVEKIQDGKYILRL